MVTTTTVSSIEQRIVAAVRIVAPTIIVAFYFWRIFGGLDPIARFSDDFFYYTLSAKNWVDGAGSTFFPGEPTNGYHPLWFLCVALLYWVAGDGVVFFALVDIALMALTIVFFFLFQRFLQRLTDDRLAAVVGAAVAAITLCPIVMGGVETALTVVAAALLLDYLSRKPLADLTERDAAVVGLLGAFLLLSRLDAAFLVPGLLIAVLFRWDWRRLAAVVVGATPVYLYFAFNLIVYGHLGTTSMAAKSLTTHWPPNLWFITHPRPVEGVVTVTGVFVVAVAVAVMLRRSEDADMRRITLALAFAPVVQLIAQAVLSGWVLFPWYFYFFLMTLGVAAALFVVRLRRWNALRRAGIPLGVLALVILPAGLVGAATPDLAQQAGVGNVAQLEEFAAGHPGVYAMGDAAGAPAWVMGRPIVHLEGLMMGHDFLDRIRAQQPLDKVFRDYHVNYYVTMRPVADENNCREFAEPNPAQASPRAPVMTTTICRPSVEVVETGDYRLYVYRIDPATGKAI